MLHEEKPSLQELQHYGVLGMKWGIRKDRRGSGRKRGPGDPKKVIRKRTVEDKNSDILDKNPFAAVINYKAIKKT